MDKIFKITWDDCGWGYCSFIVVADNEHTARNVFPNGDENDWDMDSHYSQYWIPKDRTDELMVEYIGVYNEVLDEPYIVMNTANVDGI